MSRLILPSRFRQRGSITHFISSISVDRSPPGVVTVSGETISDIDSRGNVRYRASLIIQADGTMDKVENTGNVQIDVATDWVIPNSAASAFFEVKFDKTSGQDPDAASTLSDGVWASLGSGQNIIMDHEIGEGVGSSEIGFTLSIRFDGGAVLDSASYALNAERLI